MRESSPKGRSVGPRPFLYSPLFTNVGEVEFCELRRDGVLRSSTSAFWPSTKFVLTIGPVLCAIHPSAWNRNSAKFVFTEFYKVRLNQVTSNSLPEVAAAIYSAPWGIWNHARVG
jgi:hypothetical protein